MRNLVDIYEKLDLDNVNMDARDNTDILLELERKLEFIIKKKTDENKYKNCSIYPALLSKRLMYSFSLCIDNHSRITFIDILNNSDIPYTVVLLNPIEKSIKIEDRKKDIPIDYRFTIDEITSKANLIEKNLRELLGSYAWSIGSLRQTKWTIE